MNERECLKLMEIEERVIKKKVIFVSLFMEIEERGVIKKKDIFCKFVYVYVFFFRDVIYDPNRLLDYVIQLNFGTPLSGFSDTE